MHGYVTKRKFKIHVLVLDFASWLIIKDILSFAVLYPNFIIYTVNQKLLPMAA